MNCLPDVVSNAVKKGNVYCFSVLFFCPFSFFSKFLFSHSPEHVRFVRPQLYWV